MRHLIVGLLGSTLLACGGGGGVDLDGGSLDGAFSGFGDAGVPTDPTAPFEVAPPAPPNAPALPDMGACPSAWTTTDVGGLRACEPREVDPGCASAEAHFVDRSGCVPIGNECPASGLWPADAPEDAIYVDPSAAGGDGTREAPFASFDLALGAAGPGDVIVLGPGTHEPGRPVPAGVSIRGVCPEATAIDCDGAALRTGLVINTSGVTVQDVVIRRCDVGIQSDAGHAPDYTLRGVLVERFRRTGWLLGSGQAHAQNVVLRDADPVAVEGAGAGIRVQGATLNVESIVVDRAASFGVWIRGATGRATLSRVAVRHTEADPALGTLGIGFVTDTEAMATLSESVVEDSADYGVVAIFAGTELRLDRSVVRRSGRSRVPGVIGVGLGSLAGAQVLVSRSFLRDNHGGGVDLALDGARLDAEDLVIFGSSDDALSEEAPGALAGTGTSLALRRVLMAGTSLAGVLGVGSGAAVEAEDLTVLDTRRLGTDPEIANAVGAAVLDGAAIRLERAELINVFDHGVLATDGNAELVDVRIDGVQRVGALGACGVCAMAGDASLRRVYVSSVVGWGLSVEQGTMRGEDVELGSIDVEPGVSVYAGDSDLTLQRTLIGDPGSAGVVAIGEGTTVLEDLSVVYADGRADDFGYGIALDEGASMEVTRAVVQNARTVGVFVDTSSLVVSSLLVDGVRPDLTDRFGRGINVQRGGSMRGSDVTVRGAHSLGLGVLGADAMVDLSNVYIRETREDACAPRCDATGVGAGVHFGARVALQSFWISNNHLAGLYLGDEGDLMLRRGVVSGHPIGVNVSQTAFDISRISEDVRYVNNERNFDAAALPVPAVAGELPTLPNRPGGP